MGEVFGWVPSNFWWCLSMKVAFSIMINFISICKWGNEASYILNIWRIDFMIWVQFIKSFEVGKDIIIFLTDIYSNCELNKHYPCLWIALKVDIIDAIVNCKTSSKNWLLAIGKHVLISLPYNNLIRICMIQLQDS